MADHKKWFKVWTSILIDQNHMNLSLEDVGRWARLGALMVSQGDNGKLEIIPPAKYLLTLMQCDTFKDLQSALQRLPNVQIEEGKNDNGKTTVSMLNWFKYQMDSTGYERVKRSRYKRREEKSREEERRKEEIAGPVRPSPFALRREELKVQDLESFIRRWKQLPKAQKDSAMAEIMTGIKAFRLGFKMEDEIYKKIMGDPNASNGGASGISYSALARAKREAEETRNKTSRGPVSSGIRDLPDVQPATDSD